MKTFKSSSKDSKVKLTLEDFNLNKIENPNKIIGRGYEGASCSHCTSGDEGCCDDNHHDDDGPTWEHCWDSDID